MKMTEPQVNPPEKTGWSFPGSFNLKLVMTAVLAVFLTVTAARGEEEGEAFKYPHNYAKKELCEYCHKGMPPALTFDPVTTCTRCHPGNVGNHPVTKHPVGVIPRIHIPANLPLTREGALVCYTCHDQHNRTNLQNMLRVEYYRLCASCHVGY